MKWLTQAQVKAAAKTEKTAKICSELHWWQLGHCTEEELKKKVRQYPKDADMTMVSYCFCAFCARHSHISCNSNGKCLLKNKMNCCGEYADARDAFEKWQDDPTPANFKAFQVKAKIMWRKIKNL